MILLIDTNRIRQFGILDKAVSAAKKLIKGSKSKGPIVTPATNKPTLALPAPQSRLSKSLDARNKGRLANSGFMSRRKNPNSFIRSDPRLVDAYKSARKSGASKADAIGQARISDFRNKTTDTINKWKSNKANAVTSNESLKTNIANRIKGAKARASMPPPPVVTPQPKPQPKEEVAKKVEQYNKWKKGDPTNKYYDNNWFTKSVNKLGTSGSYGYYKSAMDKARKAGDSNKLRDLYKKQRTMRNRIIKGTNYGGVAIGSGAAVYGATKLNERRDR